MRFIEGEIDKALFEKHSAIYKAQINELREKSKLVSIDSSNLEKKINKWLDIAENASDLWYSSDFDDKNKLQYSIFPSGILYNKQIDTVRTPKVNSLYACIPVLTKHFNENKNGSLSKKSLDSHLVASPRIELGSGASETLILSIVLQGQRMCR